MSSSPDQVARRWLSDAVATRDLERLTPNMAAAGDRINDARRHIRSARTIVEDDRTLAFAACHDAIRKAITAHMTALGYRPRAGEGAHRIVLDYARQQLHTVITKDQLDDADAIRGGCTCTPDTDATAHNEVAHTATSRQLQHTTASLITSTHRRSSSTRGTPKVATPEQTPALIPHRNRRCTVTNLRK